MPVDLAVGDIWRDRNTGDNYRQIIEIQGESLTYKDLNRSDDNSICCQRTITTCSFFKWAWDKRSPQEIPFRFRKHLVGANQMNNSTAPAADVKKFEVRGATPCKQLANWADLVPGDVVKTAEGSYLVIEAVYSNLAAQKMLLNLQTNTASTPSTMQATSMPFIRVDAILTIK